MQNYQNQQKSTMDPMTAMLLNKMILDNNNNSNNKSKKKCHDCDTHLTGSSYASRRRRRKSSKRLKKTDTREKNCNGESEENSKQGKTQYRNEQKYKRDPVFQARISYLMRRWRVMTWAIVWLIWWQAD